MTLREHPLSANLRKTGGQSLSTLTLRAYHECPAGSGSKFFPDSSYDPQGARPGHGETAPTKRDSQWILKNSGLGQQHYGQCFTLDNSGGCSHLETSCASHGHRIDRVFALELLYPR
jgi:hypothetical protein